MTSKTGSCDNALAGNMDEAKTALAEARRLEQTHDQNHDPVCPADTELARRPAQGGLPGGENMSRASGAASVARPDQRVSASRRLRPSAVRKKRSFAKGALGGCR